MGFLLLLLFTFFPFYVCVVIRSQALNRDLDLDLLFPMMSWEFVRRIK